MMLGISFPAAAFIVRMKVKPVLSVLAKVLIIMASFMATSLIWVFWYQEAGLLKPWIITIILTLIPGLILAAIVKGQPDGLRIKEGYLTVTLAWLLMGISGSLPFMLTGAIPSFIDALFESVSGLTTTGSSILTDVEVLPKSLLYWRSLTHWIGGMGIIVLVIAILPALRIAGYHLISLETSAKDPEKIIPRTSDTARVLWLIYIAMTAILVLLLVVGGMDFFDALCHAFGTVATGGYSTKNASVGYYSSYIQYVIMTFMLLAGINFSLYIFLIKGDFRRIFRNSELKAYLLIIFTVGVIVATIIYQSNNYGPEASFRASFFQVISIITATGFATADYMKWQEMAWMLILSLMFIGACVGSTGGGIKVMRHVIAYRNIQLYFTRQLHPNLVKPLRVNGLAVSEDRVNATVTFIFLYLVIVAFSALFMAGLGLDTQTSLGAVLATMGGIGPGIGMVGPAGNFSFIPDAGKLYLSLLMILGRLEIMTVLVLFSPSFWRR